MKMILDIRQNVLAFHKHILSDPHHRYRSWDHCYSFFKKRKFFSAEDMDLASLHLAFYLASWGTYRGSSFLLWKDYRIHIPAVRMLLRDQYKPLWIVDFNTVKAESAEVNLLFDLVSKLKQPYTATAAIINGVASQRIPTDTLITKIMLGTLACTPAYDSFVINGMRYLNEFPARFGLAGYLGCIEFYQKNKKSFKATQADIAAHGMKYPPMKLVDMYFWSIGNQLQSDK